MSDEPMIPIARPALGNAEAQALRRVVLSGWVMQGPEVAAFEKEFAEYVGARHAVAVSSGTAALHLALLAAGVGEGDDVVTVSHSFVATANAVRYCGARPLFADVEPAAFNIDAATVEHLITPRTRAILCVHQLGMPCDVVALSRLARARGLPLVEDAACAVGSEIEHDGRWERIGRPHGDVACFSFHPRKLLTTGDGGMLTTALDDWASAFRRWRQHGTCGTAPESVGGVSFESYEVLGYNYRLTDLQAAVGREQLKRLPGLVSERRARARRYHELLATVPGLRLPVEPPWARSNWQSYAVWLPNGCDQRRVMEAMLEAGVATRRGVTCAHREPAYAVSGVWGCGEGPGPCGCAPGSCERLRESERAQDRTVVLPLLPDMTDAQQDRVVAALRSACYG